jgi:hypothetical protein
MLHDATDQMCGPPGWWIIASVGRGHKFTPLRALFPVPRLGATARRAALVSRFRLAIQAGAYVNLTMSSPMRSLATRRSGGRGPAKKGVPVPSTTGRK